MSAKGLRPALVKRLMQKGMNIAMKKKVQIAAKVFVLTFCLLSGCGSTGKQQEELLLLPVEEASGKEAGSGIEDLQQTEDPGKEDKAIKETYVVHICGAVKNPGIYIMEEGSRIYQAIEQAGGFCEEADQDYLNQADRLMDGMKLYVPTKEEAAQGPADWQSTNNSSVLHSENMLVNINTAGEELLCTLSGVGSTRAKSIIAYREKNGAFQKIEDIMNVDGIKDGLFQKIKDSITV